MSEAAAELEVDLDLDLDEEPVQRRNLGLRARVIAAFALGAGLLSMLLSLSSYIVVRHTLVDQREALAERQAYINASVMRNGLRSTRIDAVGGLVKSLQDPSDSESFLYYQGQLFSTGDASPGQNPIPASLSALVIKGTPAIMRFNLHNDNKLVIGVPMPAVGASYFEVTDLVELEHTMEGVQLALVIAAIVTTLGGLALGRWASRVVLRPVMQAAYAAQVIAEGDMNARLRSDGDGDLDRLVLSFNRMVDALQARIERDARFSSDVSHELRSPLMTLSSGLSVLQSRRHELPPRSQLALDLLSDEVQRFQRMVQDLLEISRTDAGHLDIALEEVRVGEFVDRVVEHYERDIPIEAEAGVSDAILLVDKRRFERVIGNLIENADRYAGGVVSIGLQWAGRDVRIVVDDAGPGVPLDERERIFERFARGKEARSRASGEGTGLGLSLVEEHVRLHKGKVWVEDRPGGGARFVVQMPRSIR